MIFLGGFVVPLRFFPDWLQPLLLALPFAAIIQIPADIFVGRLTGTELLGALAGQALWAVVAPAGVPAGRVAAMRRVSVQGG